MHIRNAFRFFAAVAMAVAVAVGAPAASFAASSEWEGSTAIVVTGASSGQISVSAPVSLPLALRSDGSILEGSAVELRNLSSTTVAVTNICVQERSGARVVHTLEAKHSPHQDVLHLRFTPPQSSSVEASDCLDNGLTPSDSDGWRVDTGQTLVIGIEGGFLNPSETFTSSYSNAQPVSAATVVWTVEAI